MYLLLHRDRARKPSETTTRPRREHLKKTSTGVTPTWGVERVPLTTANASTYGSAWQWGISYERFPQRATTRYYRLAGGRRRRTSSLSCFIEPEIASPACRSSKSSAVMRSAARMTARFDSTTFPPDITWRATPSRYSATTRVCSGSVSLRIVNSSFRIEIFTECLGGVVIFRPPGPAAEGTEPAPA